MRNTIIAADFQRRVRMATGSAMTLPVSRFRPAFIVRSGDAFAALWAAQIRQCPDREFGPVGNIDFAEDAIQVFLNRSFRKMQFVSDLFIQLGLSDQMNYLLFAEAELGIQWTFFRFWSAASRADAVAAVTTELSATSKATSEDCSFADINGVQVLTLPLYSSPTSKIFRAGPSSSNLRRTQGNPGK